MLAAITPVMVDWLGVAVPGPPTAHGFTQKSEWQWEDCEGWRAVAKTHEKTGQVFTYADLSGETCALRREPMTRWRVPVRFTRVDVTRDVLGFRVHPALLYMFAGTRRARQQPGDEPRPTGGWRDSAKGSTLYVGSPTSPMMLRVYTKNDAGPRLQGVWKANGHNGTSQVTRIEYQCRARQVKRALKWEGCTSDWPLQVGALWDDALARIRLCTAAPMLLRQANEAKTRDDWAELAFGCGPQKLVAPPVPALPPDPAIITRSIERFLDNGGDPRVIARAAAALVKRRG